MLALTRLLLSLGGIAFALRVVLAHARPARTRTRPADLGGYDFP